MKYINDFLILGGDMRGIYAGEMLKNEGFAVDYYGFCDVEGCRGTYRNIDSAIKNAAMPLLPLPVSRDSQLLFAPYSEREISLCEIVNNLSAEQTVFAGMADKYLIDLLEQKHITLNDYFKRDELAILNAVPTAEGVVQLLIDNLPVTISGLRCAVLGFGKTGKAIARTLHALGAQVTVAARGAADVAYASAENIHAINLEDFADYAPDFSAVINTVPARVLDEKRLSALNGECLLVEIASAPFGIDFECARALGLKVIKAGSLPGKIAPKTAGEIIAKTVISMLKEGKKT
ncbi:MAG: dipicolinate synthase subunit DpsA [Clostridiales bacterium]|nr:dipicolinate synthase subunit DpsA [Clostridiales bacterium]